MAERFTMYRITGAGPIPYFFLANPNTYQGFTEAECGVEEATDAEKAQAVLVTTKELLKSPLVTRAVVYIKKTDGKRTTKQLILPSGLFAPFAVLKQGKPTTTPPGTIVSVKRPRHRSRS